MCTFDLYGAALGDARGVWADAVPARRGRLDLEAHILVVRVLQPDELLRLRVELHWQTSRARVSPAHGRAAAAAGGWVLCGAVAACGSPRGSEPEALPSPSGGPASESVWPRWPSPPLSLAAGERARPPWPAPSRCGEGVGRRTCKPEHRRLYPQLRHVELPRPGHGARARAAPAPKAAKIRALLKPRPGF